MVNKNSEKNQNYNRNAIEQYKKIANMNNHEAVYHVRDIMTKECVTINFNKSLYEAYLLLKETKFSNIPVLTDLDTIDSIINKKTILNLLMNDIKNYETIFSQKLKEIQLPEFIITDPISDIRRVAKVMIEKKVDAIPVVNQNNYLVGIVSKSNIIQAVSHIPDLKLWA